MARAKHVNGEQQLSFLRRISTLLSVIGAVLTVLAFIILIIIAVWQNHRLEELTLGLKAQQNYIEKTVTQTNKRGVRNVQRIENICRALYPEEEWAAKC